MARLELRDVAQSYTPGEPEESWALKPLNLTLEPGHTYALVGPSGCGKTTLLNLLSGIVTPSRGKVIFDGVDVTARATRERNIAQVFQFPVIYGSMTVGENLAFPLECRGWSRDQIKGRVALVATALGLEDRLHQRARRLSGDQKQLISLGRGLVRDDVAAVLMDEPLTVIDPQLKLSLRRKIRELSDAFQPTVVYVTHDQYEAMTFAQEVIVMEGGRIRQQGTPEQLFESPASTYVGWFVGSPSMNFLDCVAAGAGVQIGSHRLRVAWEAPAPDASLQIGIRPEYVRILAPDEDESNNVLPARLVSVQDHGGTRVCELDLAGQPLTVKVPREVALPSGTALRVHLPWAKVLPYVGGELAVR